MRFEGNLEEGSGRTCVEVAHEAIVAASARPLHELRELHADLLERLDRAEDL